MPASTLIIESIKGNLGLLKMHLADMSDADLMVRSVPNANHAAWQLAHLAAFEMTVAGTVAPDQTIEKPAAMATATAKGASASDDASHFPTKDQVLAVFDATNSTIVKAVEKMTDEDLAKPGPEAFRKFAPTMGNLLLMLPSHVMMHLGQIQVLRRKLGKPHMF